MNELLRAVPLELMARILAGFVLGATVGLERERRSKAAGLRTHMLVSGGAAIFTIASFAIFTTEGTVRDPTRIAAQIVTGVGFLGAGAILRSGGSVSGLTTAASIWVAAGLGMLAGGGAYALALTGALLTIVTMRLPHKPLLRKSERLYGRGGDGDDEEVHFVVAAEERQEVPRRR